MLVKVNITWSFEGTEFENLQYEEARVNAALPKTIEVEFDEDENEMESYLYENFGFEPSEWEYID